MYLYDDHHYDHHTGACLILCISVSRVRPLVTPWTVTRQAPLSMGFSRQEYWSGLSFPTPKARTRAAVIVQLFLLKLFL